MKNRYLLLTLSTVTFFASVRAQVQNNMTGDYWLNTTAPAPRSFLIGNNPMPFPFESILNVRGDWMTNLTLGLRGEVFRTRSGWYTDLNDAFGLASNWRMLRASSPDDDDRMEMGKISCSFGLTGDPGANRGFVVTAMRNGGSLWLRNRRGRPNYDDPTEEAFNDEPSGNGFRLIDDSSAVFGDLTLNGYTRIPRLGYAALGHAINMDQASPVGEMVIPWTRFHLVHGRGFDGYEQPWPLDAVPESKPYRPFLRNGISFSGNSTYAYIGHKYLMDDEIQPAAEVAIAGMLAGGVI